MQSPQPNPTGTGALDALLDELLHAGQEPDRALLDRVKAHGQEAVRPLIEMAVDEELNEAPTESQEVWAPVHAVKILGELGAEEAIAPLLTLMHRLDDDYLREAVVAAFGGIGAPAIEPLRSMLFDREQDSAMQVYASECLVAIAQRHPELHLRVVNMLVKRLDPSETQRPDDEVTNGFVIDGLLDLNASESLPAIAKAYREDRVDTTIVSIEDVYEKFDLPLPSKVERSVDHKGFLLRLRCKACGYERDHDVETVYCDLNTADEKKPPEEEEESRYSEYVIPQRIICPKCGAVDQYEFTTWAYMTLTAEILAQREPSLKALRPPGTRTGTLKFVRFTLTDGRPMHPLAALDYYRERVEAEPEDAELQVRYGRVLDFMGYHHEAKDRYETALRLQPANLEALLNLGRIAGAAGDVREARQRYEQIRTLAPESGLPRRERNDYVEEAAAELAALTGKRAGSHLQPIAPGAAPFTVIPPPGQTARATAKVGRNDPCPCGSGQKYKKCHGR